MIRQHSIEILSLSLSLSLLLSNALVIKKRSVNQFSPVTDAQLKNALDVIERAKFQESLGYEIPQDISSPFDNNILDDHSSNRALPIYQEGPDDDGSDIHVNYDPTKLSPDNQFLQDENDQRQIYKDVGFVENSEQDGGGRQLDDKEVESIFEDSTDSVNDSNVEKVITEDEISEEKVELKPEEVDELLNEGANDQEDDHGLHSESSDQDDKSDSKIISADDSERNNIIDDDPSNKEDVPLTFSSSLKAASAKAKRSTHQPSADDTENILKNEAIEVLKTYIHQQEMENEHLTRALALAAQSQLEEDDSYVPAEIGEVRQAVANEQSLQLLRKAIAEDLLAYPETPASLEDEDMFDESRVKKEVVPLNPIAVLTDNSEDMRERMSKKSGSPDFISMPPSEILQVRNNARLMKQLENDALREKLVRYLAEGSQYFSQEDGPDASDLIQEYESYRLNPFSRDIESTNSPSQEEIPSQSEIGYENDVNDDDEAAELQICPAADSLVDGCMAATRRQLALDDEALDLCDQHQLCYRCGMVYDITPESCDRMYISEAAASCGKTADESKCHAEAFGLYAIMVRGHSSPDIAAPPECTVPCVYEVMLGRYRR